MPSWFYHLNYGDHKANTDFECPSRKYRNCMQRVQVGITFETGSPARGYKRPAATSGAASPTPRAGGGVDWPVSTALQPPASHGSRADVSECSSPHSASTLPEHPLTRSPVFSRELGVRSYHFQHLTGEKAKQRKREGMRYSQLHNRRQITATSCSTH